MLELAAECREAPLGYGAHSTSTSPLTSSRPKWGYYNTNNEEDYRDGKFGEVWRRGVPKDQPPPGKPDTEGLNTFRTPAAFSDPAIATVRYSTATHHR
jgi:hypothetical protein